MYILLPNRKMEPDSILPCMCGFSGGWHEKSFCYVWVFNPHAPSNRNVSLSSCERIKKNAYEQRIRAGSSDASDGRSQQSESQTASQP